MEIIKDKLKQLNEPSFRYEQFCRAYYKECIDSIDDIKVWPVKLRKEMNIDINLIKPVNILTSKDNNTIKVLFKRNSDSRLFETVLMKHKDGRNTVCVSCMIGCPVGCKFCATGRMGFISNITADEIVSQVLYFQRSLKKEGSKITNIVYMGMGEPMLNLKEVTSSIDILTDEDKFGIGSRRITVSTSGYINKLREFMSQGYGVRLAISLHAPTQDLREELMPVAKSNQLNDLFKLLDEYVELNNKRITYEYILIKDVNDKEEHAIKLSELLHNRLAHVNLIAYNLIDDVEYEKSDENSIIRFKNILDRNNINNTIRITMGSDVNAACGQLISKHNL